MDSEQVISHLEAMRRQENSGYACRNYFHEQGLDECKFGTPLHLRKRWLKKSRQAAPVCPSSRARMIEWCYQIVDSCGFDREPVVIAVNYLDRFLVTKVGAPALRNKNIFQLAAMTCLYTAIKLFEPEVISPEVVSAISRGTYSEKDVTNMERIILSALEWRVQPPTALDFIERFLQLINIDDRTRMHIFDECCVEVETALCDSSLIDSKPSAVAAASILNTIDLMDKKALPVGPRCSLAEVLELHGSIRLIYSAEMNRIRSKLLNGVYDEEHFMAQKSAVHRESSTPSPKSLQESTPASPQSVDKGPGSFIDTVVSTLSNAINVNDIF